jgi:DNA polymerase III epsilon subunit-like protein
MKLLLLSHDLDVAKEWALEQELENAFVIDERDLVTHNPAKFDLGFVDIDYSKKMIEYMQFMSVSYKAARPMFMLMDMRHQTAVDKIPHDASILYYDDSKRRKLAYHPAYQTTFRARSLGDLIDFSKI